MLLEKNIPNRLPGEELILFLRSHWYVIIKHYIFWGFFAALPVIIYFFFSSRYPELFNSPIVTPALFLLASSYYLFIWLMVYNVFVDYYLDVWIVTNKRIIGIEQKGLFNRQTYEHSMEKVEEVSAHQKGMLQTFFNFGEVLIQTASQAPQSSFDYISKPFEVAKTINHAAEEFKRAKG